AFRLKVHVKAKKQTGLGSEANAFWDVIYVIKGRVGYSIAAFDVGSPFNSSELQQIVSKALQKITSQANGNTGEITQESLPDELQNDSTADAALTGCRLGVKENTEGLFTTLSALERVRSDVEQLLDNTCIRAVALGH